MSLKLNGTTGVEGLVNLGQVTATGSTTARSLANRFADVVNVKDFGAVGDGVVDDTAAFSAAAQAAPAANNINGSRGTGVPRAVICYIYVPAGTYKLSTMVDTYGKEVVWELNQAAILSNPNNINGEVWRTAQRQTDEHHGSTDFACGMAFKNNGTSDSEAEVLGITSPSDLAVYADRDTVGIYVDNASPPATLDSSSGTYTSKTVTTATIPSTDAVKKLYSKIAILVANILVSFLFITISFRVCT
jgi:polygalacturonase